MKYVPLLADAERLLDRQLRSHEVTVRIQLLEEPLPGQEHHLQIKQFELQFVTFT